MIHRTLILCCQLLLVAALATISQGCTALGALAGKTGQTVVKPLYTGLAGQSLGVMVATDPGIRNDFPRIQLDVSENLVNKLQLTQKNDAVELRGATFPRTAAPDAIFAFQRNYPQLEWEPITNVAPKLGVTRLIYVEVDSFTLHPNNVPELFKGELSARIEVVEVNGNTSKVVFRDKIDASFPDEPNSPGVLSANSRDIYLKTIDAFSATVVGRFVTHEAPADAQ